MVTQAPLSAPCNSSTLSAALLKLIDVVAEENAVLHQHNIVAHAAFTDRKNQALRELMAAQRFDPSSAAKEACRPLLTRLSRELKENARLLKLNISAVGEISDIIISGLREADSDGTYSRSQAQTRW